MQFKLGLDNLLLQPPIDRVAVLTNSSGVTQDLRQNIDILLGKGIKVKKIFAPEHGIYAALRNGDDVSDETYLGIPVKSIYSEKSRSIDVKELEDVETILFDVQDAGVRPYTFLSSLKHLLAAASRSGKQVIVCDRPAPLSGAFVDGPMMHKEFRSFVGIDEVPLRYGMTIGEMAQYMNRDIGADLKISRMSGYLRSHYYNDYLKYYVPPSLNLPLLDSLFVYAGMVLVEAAKASVGRGTPYPFSQFGYDGAWKLDLKELQGALFRRTMFIPYSEPLNGQKLEGFFIHLADRGKFNSIILAVKVLKHLFSIDPDIIDFKHISILYGSNDLKKFLEDDSSVDAIMESWEPSFQNYMETRSGYLIYD